MRVFIAVEFNDEIKGYLGVKREEIRRNCLKGNFTIKDNFHLTLRFIGEVNEGEITKIKSAIDETSSGFKNFSISLGNLGQFPRQNKSIIWIGVGKGYSDLKTLFQKLELNLEKRGFKREEKELKPHITIGREVVLNKGFDALKDEIAIENKSIVVKKISLMESSRVNGVLRYTPIYTANFKEQS